MNFHLVVALYEENMSWIFHVPYHWKITIYHKSTKLNLLNSGFNLLNREITLIQLPNVGRESHSYLTHIYKNYDSLGDVTLFCQGNPFEQCPDFAEYLQNKQFLGIMLYAMKRFPDNMQYGSIDINAGFVSLGKIWPYEGDGSDFDNRTNRCLCKIWTDTFGNPSWPSPARTVWGAQFAITKDAILKYPKSWYKQMIDLHENEEQYYEMPWAFEKIWAELFVSPCPVERGAGCKLFL